MQNHHAEEIPSDSAEIHAMTVSIGKVEKNVQTTVKNTGWTEEEKEQMKRFGYDSLDIVRAWYS
jgi:hypothetical protein